MTTRETIGKHLIHRYLPALLTLLSAASATQGCSSRRAVGERDNLLASSNGNSGLSPITCPLGQNAYSFSLLQSGARDELVIEKVLIQGHQVNKIAHSPKYPGTGMRLDLCLEQERATLQRVLLKSTDIGLTDVFHIGSEPPSNLGTMPQLYRHRMVAMETYREIGLSEAILGDYSRLLIAIDEKDSSGNTGKQVQIDGRKVNGDWTVVSGYVTRDSGGVSWRHGLFGDLDVGDKFASAGPCPFGMIIKKFTTKIEKVMIKSEICRSEIDFNSNFLIRHLSIKDDSTALPPHLRGVWIELDSEKIKLKPADTSGLQMYYTANHHDFCDAFRIVLPHAEYAALSSPAGESIDQCMTTGNYFTSVIPSLKSASPSQIAFGTRYLGEVWNSAPVSCSNSAFKTLLDCNLVEE